MKKELRQTVKISFPPQALRVNACFLLQDQLIDIVVILSIMMPIKARIQARIREDGRQDFEQETLQREK